MDSNNSAVDSPITIGYNVSTENDENVVVKMDEQVPINDTDCRHETLVPDTEDTIGDAVYHGCANMECGVGFYVRK